MEFIEEETTISPVKELMVQMIIKTRVASNVIIAKNMDIMLSNAKPQDERDNTKQTLAHGHVENEPALLMAIFHNK